jgi:hypothetical protein
VLVFVRVYHGLHPLSRSVTPIYQAGLFSAILTAFIVEVYKGLEEDPLVKSVDILLRISVQLNGSFDDSASGPRDFSPSATTVAVNMLWFSSLILSLFAALLGILAKQWLHVYGKWPEREQYKDTVILRYVYQEGFLRWHVPEFIGLLPVLLQIALLLFVIGLVAYMWTLNSAIAGVLSALVAIMIAIAITTIILPLFFEDCPYKSPIGLVIGTLKSNYFGGSRASNFSSWQRRDLSKAKPRLKEQLSNDVVSQSGLILDLAPRSDLELELANIIEDDTLLGSRIRGLSEATLRLLSDLVVNSIQATEKQPKGDEAYKRELHASRLLEYISRVAIGDTRRGAAKAVIDLVAHLGDGFKGGVEIVRSMVHRNLQEQEKCV